MERLYAEIAEVKEPFDRDNLWRMFAVWAVLRGYQFGLAPTRRNT
jgi:16S rRNA (cytosine967-C5)-methyltransferase